jgi:hypothetical protein
MEVGIGVVVKGILNKNVPLPNKLVPVNTNIIVNYLQGHLVIISVVKK